jgi:hypothetical protein
MLAARSMVLGLLALAGASACTAPVPPAACPLPSQRAMVVAELYFGRAIAGRAPLTEDEWRGFAAEVVSAQFPDGFTAFDGDGAWRDPATGATVREPTKVLVVAVAPSQDLPARLTAVIDAYRTRYHQKSVGLITTTACAAF